MQQNRYTLKSEETVNSPALLYYRDILKENTAHTIAMAGDAGRLWPHVKTHKTAAVVKMQMELGITRFKCATIAEAEMLAQAGAAHILLAYPLVGPNIQRFIALCKTYPQGIFYAVGDAYGPLEALAKSACAANMQIQVFLDINMGMNRTGIVYAGAQALYKQAASLKGLEMAGMHCYDGHHNMTDVALRKQKTEEAALHIVAIQSALQEEGISCEHIVIGGTPSFPCYAQERHGWFLSPGTIFFYDMAYVHALQDMAFTPAAAVMTRVVSHPNKGLFTLDLGSKGIAADPPGVRGVIVGMETARPVGQSEEHWVFEMEEGREEERPAIGTVLYVIPTHICPTSALYPSVLVAEGGELVDEWEITARNRKLTL